MRLERRHLHPRCFAKRGWICLIAKELTFSALLPLTWCSPWPSMARNPRNFQQPSKETRMSRLVLLACTCFALVLLSPTTVSAPAAPDADKEAAFRSLDATPNAMPNVTINICSAAALALHEHKSTTPPKYSP